MLFNSFHFLCFLPIVFCAYWLIGSKSRGIQNTFLLISSFYFYSCWDWRFAGLLLFSILLDYITGIQIEAAVSDKRKKIWFWVSIGTNLTFLGIFKYYNFFAQSFSELTDGFGLKIEPWLLNIVLPVGISFYTFHGLSYVIDIYKKRIVAERSIVNYALFVSFFPLLVAGPIERATHLLPQIKTIRTFNYSNAVDGLRQILWGVFKKVVIADICAEYANETFNNPSMYSGSNLSVGVICFAIQIYGDFSGYSDIALGVARLFGFNLLQNFSFPYFSRDIAEFWRRWHISLSSWFRDYLYIPLGGNKGTLTLKIRNTFIIFIVSGFWHGANMTFIFWGFLNAVYFLPLLLSNKTKNNIEIIAFDSKTPKFKEILLLLFTFTQVCFAWIFFRASSLSEAFEYIDYLFSFSILSAPNLLPNTVVNLILFFFVIEWFGRKGKYGLQNIALSWRRPLRWLLYAFIVFLIGIYVKSEHSAFIYFQF